MKLAIAAILVTCAANAAVTITIERSAATPAFRCYPLWLHYAYLQEHRFDDARKALDACRASAFASPFVSGGEMDSYAGRIDSFADMRAHQIASGGTLIAADDVTIPAGAEHANARFTMAYGDVLVAHDLATLKTAVARLHELQKDALTSAEQHHSMNPSQRIRAEVMAQQADALLLVAEGKRDEAIAMLEKTAKSETAMPFEFGPPVVEKPTYELLGDELLAAGRAADAAAAYRTALERVPGRAATVEGLRDAQKAR